MSVLAAELRRWASVLEALDPDLVEGTLAMARRLDTLFGPLRPRDAARLGEPDGYRDITPRGPFDRLLLSEWALLDELPDEFIRRAASNELGFFELARKAPATGLRVRAVLDVGPGQLGAPRLGQLAALLTLQRRATASSATFEWSVAQAPEKVHTTVNEASVAAWRAARSAAPFELPSFEGEPPADELWVIGPPPNLSWRGLRVLELREADDDAGDDRLLATVHRSGRAPESAELPLPPHALRLRLLLHPFANRPPRRASNPSAPRSRQTAGGVGAEWSAVPPHCSGPVAVQAVPGSEQVIFRFASGYAIPLALGSLSPTYMPRLRETSLGPHPTVAVGYRGQRIEYLDLRPPPGGGDSTYQLVGRSGWSGAAPGPGPGFGRLFHINFPSGTATPHATTWVLDDERTLWRVDLGMRTFKVELRGVLAVGSAGDVWRVVAESPEGPALFQLRYAEPSRVCGYRGATAARFSPECAGHAPTLLVGHGTRWMRHHAWAGSPTPTGEAHIAPEGAEVLFGSAHGAPPVWVTWVPGQPDLLIGGEVFTLPRVPKAAVVVGVAGRLLALYTERSIEIWDLHQREPLMLRDCP